MKLWAQARVVFGMGREEFWSLTPREWSELLATRREVERREDWRSAIIAWSIHRVNLKDFRQKITDFMIDPPKVKKGGDLLQKMIAANAALGGKDLRGRK